MGIAAAPDGRVFVSFSRAIDETSKISVAEVKDGKAVAFPPGFRQENGTPANDRLLSVQSLIVDNKNRLWLLDSAKVGQNPVASGAPKLVAYDLASKKVARRINFPASVAGKTSFLNGLRVDLSRGKEGTIYITDASPEGPNGIVVVDIASGRSKRRLNDHPSTKPDPKVTLMVGANRSRKSWGPTPDNRCASAPMASRYLRTASICIIRRSPAGACFGSAPRHWPTKRAPRSRSTRRSRSSAKRASPPTA